MILSACQVAQWTGGQLSPCPAELIFSGISTDSRKLCPGDLYIALIGARFDGHDFLPEAQAKQAAAAVVNRPTEGALPLIRVTDTQQALQAIAGGYRQQFSLPVVAVTGSVGKTTTKDMLAHLLSVRCRVLKTEGNYNNEIGLPLTLLQLTERHTAAVVEMGMRASGQIAALGRISRPTYGIITNIAPVHLETMGSLEAIAEAKCELLGVLPEDGFCLLPSGEALLCQAARKYPVTQYFFGTDDGCAVRLLDMKTTVAGVVFTASLFGRKLKALLPLPAPRLVMNALAAAGVACQLGLSPDDIRQALASFQPGRNRLEIRLLAAGGIVINDVYNANPLSMQNALEVLAALSSGKKSAAVLGDMYELGAYATTGHQLVGKKAAALRIDTLVTVGELAAIIGQSARRAGMPANQVHSFIQPSDCLAWLREQVTPDQVVLFKASRGVKLETILAGWLDGGTD